MGLSIVTDGLGKERKFERHALAQLADHRNHLKNKMEKMSGILRKLQMEVVRERKEKTKTFRGHRNHEKLLDVALKTKRKQVVGLVAELRRKVMEDKDIQRRLAQTIKTLAKLMIELKKRKESTERQSHRLRKVFKRYSVDLVKLNELRTVLVLERHTTEHKLHQESDKLKELKTRERQGLSSTRRDDEVLLRRKKKVLAEVHRLLRKLARLQKLKRAWELKVDKGSREIAETLRTLKKEKNRDFQILSKLKKVAHLVDSSAQRAKRKQGAMKEKMENAEKELKKTR